jgi:hypothetical protein
MASQQGPVHARFSRGWAEIGVPSEIFDLPITAITCDAGDPGDFAPLPPIPIPDWRRFERVHPKSSQIGVDFSDQASIGVWFGAFGFSG